MVPNRPQIAKMYYKRKSRRRQFDCLIVIGRRRSTPHHHCATLNVHSVADTEYLCNNVIPGQL